MNRILNQFKLRGLSFGILAVLHALSLLGMTSPASISNSNYVTALTSLEADDEQYSTAEFGHIVDDLLKSTGSSEHQDDPVNDGRRLAAQLLLGDTTAGDVDDSVTSEADQRLERLVRVAESARYQLEEAARRSRMEPLVSALRDVVDKMKRLKGKLDQPPKSETDKLNLYQQDENT